MPTPMVDWPSTRGLKTWEACRSRWIKLRKDYNLALQLKQNLSGFTFVDQEGVVVDDESVWSEFASKNYEAVRVGRAGFPCFELMSSLMPSVARGTFTGHPLQHMELGHSPGRGVIKWHYIRLVPGPVEL
ncbi:hypothetical protein K439DRAFT_1619387 [Ramaria rubella]|nr:hypothetical protein K439DRAFT_1619387 [Ramaria rubella]